MQARTKLPVIYILAYITLPVKYLHAMNFKRRPQTQLSHLPDINKRTSLIYLTPQTCIFH